MKQQRRRTRKQQFEDACTRLETLINNDSEGRPIRFALHRVAIGTVFLMQTFDPKRAQKILKQAYLIYNNPRQPVARGEGTSNEKDTGTDNPETDEV